MNRISRRFGQLIARYLTAKRPGYLPFAVNSEAALRANLLPGDVLLVEGDLRISSAIKYLTQSTWSHAALYIGNALSPMADPNRPDIHCFIEADLQEGVVARPYRAYTRLNSRICRPFGLPMAERQRVVADLVGQIGKRYDLKNVFDLFRYLLPKPPIGARARHHMLRFGSGDPTRAICSTLIAQAFQQVGYPILPTTRHGGPRPVMVRRHHSLFTPRDFDLSPYFEIVKPTHRSHFDYRRIIWQAPGEEEG